MILGNHEVVLVSEGQRLEEYQTEVTSRGDPPRYISTCWVPSNHGRRFRLQVRGGENESLRVKIYADGELLDLRTADRLPLAVYSGNRYTRETKGTFVFAPPGWVPIEEFDEDERDMSDPTKWLKRGTITLELCYVKVAYGPPKPREETSHLYSANQRQLHTVAVGPTVISPKEKDRMISFAFLKPYGDQPVHTFHFKHRPQEWLEKYSIMPPPLFPNFANLSLDRPPTPPIVRGLTQLSISDFEIVENTPAGAEASTASPPRSPS